MARSANEKHYCPLYDRSVYWSECVEVQEVREDEMDMDLLPEPFDFEDAEIKCNECRWCFVRG